MSPKRMPTILVLAMTTCLSFAFVPPHSYTVRLSPSYAAGKGFGEKNVSPKKQPNKKLEYNDQWTSSSSYNEESNKSVENPIMREQTNNAGQKALQELRRQRAEEKDAELRKMVEMRRMDELAKETPAVIPEKVAMRMGKRMLPFVGIPLFGGMGAFIAFWYLATYKNMEFQPAMVAFTTIAILAVGLLVRIIVLFVLFVVEGCRSLPFYTLTVFPSFPLPVLYIPWTGNYIFCHECFMGP